MAKQTKMTGKGFESAHDAEIEELAEDWEEAADAHAGTKTTLEHRRDDLVAKMQAKKVKKYTSPKRGKVFEIESNSRLKVHKLPKPKAEKGAAAASSDGGDGE